MKRHPNLTEKLASALLELQEWRVLFYEAPADQRISLSEAKQMTAAQIVSLFRADHSIHHTWGGSTHPCNITMRLIKASREHTRKVDVPQITKVRRRAKKQAQRMPVDVTGARDDTLEAAAKRFGIRLPKSRPMPCGRKSKFKKKLSGKVERRA